MPVDPVGKGAVEILQENISRFKEFMNKIDNLQKESMPEQLNEECETEIEKIKSLKNLKNLIKNYKYVVESQDKLLNKAIVKQNEFKPVILQNQ